ncbi:hypothetical protein UZ36_04405 [Candidatus Nitromaritima sp. SCGC AAA799-C22]|nr:hypothetical protein UZ36_04405 [Candidatus Nitromaritima sp. SCGC AAA799-C22]
MPYFHPGPAEKQTQILISPPFKTCGNNPSGQTAGRGLLSEHRPRRTSPIIPLLKALTDYIPSESPKKS